MSDFPNGRPPGQNNLDATSERYVAPENDPSATAQRPDEVRSEDDGIEIRDDETDDETKQELREASRNVVQPGSVEDNKQRDEESQSQPRVENVAPEPVKSPPSDEPKTARTTSTATSTKK